MTTERKSSIGRKITTITITSIIIAISIITFIIFRGLKNVEDETLVIIDENLTSFTEEYYTNYMNELAKSTQEEIDRIFAEMHILGGITQTYLLNATEFKEITAAMAAQPFFRDNLTYSGDYYQNAPDEPTSLLVQKYMLDDEAEIPEDIQKKINQTMFLDLVMPAFASYGVDKAQLYFEGGANEEFTRMAPWKNIGEEVYDVYPDLHELPLWETFNPGLAEQWEQLLLSAKGDYELNTGFARATPPVQDGVTGQVVITVSQPLISEDLSTFAGVIAYDVPINHLIENIESIELAETGFAFLSQSNGNLFALNEEGLTALGLKSDEDSVVTGSSGFHRLERSFSDSSYSDIRGLQLRTSNQVAFEDVLINGRSFVLITKDLPGFQSWSESLGFFDEHWTLGFLVPQDEIYKLYDDTEKAIDAMIFDVNREIILVLLSILTLLIVIIFFTNQQITKNLRKLVEATNSLKNKNYHYDLDIDSNDEVGELGRAFKAMSKEIRHSINQLEIQNDKLQVEMSDRRKKDRIINYLENFDSMTDLPNKKALLNILQDLKAEDDHFTSLMVIGLDDFRRINEAYSWKFGDRLIRIIADRLLTITREERYLFKLSGDEFGVLHKSRNIQELLEKVEEILAAFEAPFVVENIKVKVQCSMGISSFPYDGSDPLDVLKYATTAMIHAKEHNKGNYEFYDEEINSTAINRMEMISELRSAIEKGEMSLYYQPIVDLKTEEWTGLEALLRWESPKLGTISPSVFIPIAEQTKMIVDIGAWVTKQAMMDMKFLHDHGHDHLQIGINVSAIQLLESDIHKTFKEALSLTGLPGDKVIMEITEGLFIEDVKKTQIVLSRMIELGITISVDDFGTGYSSLAYLKNLPISKLKVDRVFVNEIHEDKGQEITNAIIALGKNLNLKVVGEGIETKEQLDHLKKRNCDEGQGYFFEKPMPFDQIKKSLERSS